MSAMRQLWTGPYGATVRDLALRGGRGGTWIVPTPLAREQVTVALASRRAIGPAPRVWCWGDAWRSVRGTRADAPALLSTAAVRATLREAIAEVRRAGLLLRLGPVADSPGVLRRLRARIAAWTRQERDPRRPPSRPLGLIEVEEWEIFARYRGLLKALKADDPEGFAAWASRVLERDSPSGWPGDGPVTIVDPIAPDRAGWRALGAICAHASDLLVTLPFDPDPSLADAYATTAKVRDRLLSWGFEETPHSPPETRSEGLDSLESALFRGENRGRLRPENTDGLAILGAPKGEGEAAVVAGSVRRLLDDGAEPGSILVLTRHANESAGLIRETLEAWGIPAWSSACPGLSASPSVSALALAMGLPAGGWEATDLVTLLRHGQIRPDWAVATDSLALAFAAAAVRDTRVFRDRARLRDALRRQSAPPEKGSGDDLGLRKRRAKRAEDALPIFDRLATVLDGLDRPAAWAVQVDRLRAIAEDLGIGVGDDAGTAAIGTLFDALDDQGKVVETLGRREAPWDWAEFAEEVRLLIRDGDGPSSARLGGMVRVVSVDEAEGACANHVILADLAEGTFPTREAIDPSLAEVAEGDEADEARPRVAFAREMLRFLRVVGSAGSSLTLVHPTADEKGQTLLAAGFLDDTRRLFSPTATPPFAAPIFRLDPALMPAHLAGLPADERARAVALAGAGTGAGELRRLARSPRHRKALLGAADALRVAQSRSVDRQYGPFDGMLADQAAIRRIADDFAPARHAFSPSQLESLALCPFQFFQKYILRLEPIDEYDELDEDLAARGSLIHRVLEDLHKNLRHEPAGSRADQISERIFPIIEHLLEGDLPGTSDVAGGLLLIQAERLRQVGRRYVGQFARYAESDGSGADCQHLEIVFGEPDNDQAFPALVLGEGTPLEVRLRGKVDRIDLVTIDAGPYFRVIDYKSGAGPGRTKVESGLALQLPLYAMAVERHVVTETGAGPLDVGYWELKSKGYQPVVKMVAREGKAPPDWAENRGRIEGFVLEMVDRLRKGVFPVHPRADDCTRLCDYRAICRIAQVRSASKPWADQPTLEPSR